VKGSICRMRRVTIPASLVSASFAPPIFGLRHILPVRFSAKSRRSYPRPDADIAGIVFQG
jgi:hypothetical protein